MKVSVSLPDGDVDFLDNYAHAQGLPLRSAVLHNALRLLRGAEFAPAYEASYPDRFSPNSHIRPISVCIGYLVIPMCPQLLGDRRHIDIEIRQQAEQCGVVRPPRDIGEFPHRYRAERGPVPIGKPLQSLHHLIRNISQVQRLHVAISSE